MMRQPFLLFFFLCFFCCLQLIVSCNSSYTPKPAGYFKIDFPERAYRSFDEPGYPYTFEYPVYARVVKDSTYFGEPTENPWWINVEFPDFNGRIYISYKEIGKIILDTLIRDAYRLSNKHNTMAYSIEDTVFITPNKIPGVYFTVGGNVATANQFFVTDSVRHFLRGALYFDATPNADSLGIVNGFLLTDMKHLVNTLRWRQR
jgi:gliding motility-associated lipoprotein GldD